MENFICSNSSLKILNECIETLFQESWAFLYSIWDLLWELQIRDLIYDRNIIEKIECHISLHMRKFAKKKKKAKYEGDKLSGFHIM